MKGSIPFALVFLIVAGCTTNSQPAKEKIYDVKGKVMSVDVEKKKVNLDHEEIPGLMKAMKMDFYVNDAMLLEGLKAGDSVQGKTKRGDGNWVLLELKKQ